MRKENLMFGIFGLVIGLIVGFVFANSVNKSGIDQSSAQTTSVAGTGDNPALPPDHPPLGTSSGDGTATAPLPQVMESIEKAKQQPQDFEAQMTAADLYYQIQRFDDAAKYYEAAAKLKPAELEPIIKTGNAFFDADKYEIAETWYLQALEKEPKNINVRNDLGLTFFLRNPRDTDRAIREYKTALDIEPNHEITLQNLLLAYNENGDKDARKTTLDKLKSINPNNPAVKKLEGN